ncbi:hypothetical protein LTR48_007586, partial [Friedmanniomyces endolithicus]
QAHATETWKSRRRSSSSIHHLTSSDSSHETSHQEGQVAAPRPCGSLAWLHTNTSAELGKRMDFLFDARRCVMGRIVIGFGDMEDDTSLPRYSVSYPRLVTQAKEAGDVSRSGQRAERHAEDSPICIKRQIPRSKRVCDWVGPMD